MYKRVLCACVCAKISAFKSIEKNSLPESLARLAPPFHGYNMGSSEIRIFTWNLRDLQTSCYDNSWCIYVHPQYYKIIFSADHVPITLDTDSFKPTYQKSRRLEQMNGRLSLIYSPMSPPSIQIFRFDSRIFTYMRKKRRKNKSSKPDICMEQKGSKFCF